MCFIRAWKTGFEAIARAKTLSHHKIGGWERIQHNSAEAMARALYSDSVEERETVGCFLANQVIVLEPR